MMDEVFGFVSKKDADDKRAWLVIDQCPPPEDSAVIFVNWVSM